MHLAERLELPPGLAARPYAGTADHPQMAIVLTEARRAKGIPELVTTEDLDGSYQHLTDCDPDLDIAIVEEVRDGERVIVAYSRPVFSRMEDDSLDLIVFAPIRDSHRSAELFDAFAAAMEPHLRKWLDGSPARYRGYAGHPGPNEAATGEAAWFEQRGYEITRMVGVAAAPEP